MVLLFLWFMSVLMLIPRCFEYCSFVIKYEVRECDTSNFILLKYIF